MTFGITVYNDPNDTKKTINMLMYSIDALVLGTAIAIGSGYINKEGLSKLFQPERSEQVVQKVYSVPNNLENKLIE